jgi:putative hydrolase of the HAD superfamily
VRYILWDFDNTLAYRPGLWSQVLADLVNRNNPEIAAKREDFAPHLSSGFPWHTPERGHTNLSDATLWWNNLRPVFIKALMAGANITAAGAGRIAANVQTEYTRPDAWVVFPDTVPALVALSSRGWRHVVLSNHVPELPRLVANLGLHHHFERIFSSAALGYEKPNPLAFRAVMASLPVAERIVMVGDSFDADYQGAMGAGIDAVLVRNPHPACAHFMPDIAGLAGYLDSQASTRLRPFT